MHIVGIWGEFLAFRKIVGKFSQNEMMM